MVLWIFLRGKRIVGKHFLDCYEVLTELKNAFFRIIQPQCLGGLISYFSPISNDVSLKQAYLYALGIILCTLVPVLVFHPFILYFFQIGMKIRVACCAMLYKKVIISF
jgi:ATP-binding cassette, subfamily C (CFTR/MRP), member 4